MSLTATGLWRRVRPNGSTAMGNVEDNSWLYVEEFCFPNGQASSFSRSNFELPEAAPNRRDRWRNFNFTRYSQSSKAFDLRRDDTCPTHKRVFGGEPGVELAAQSPR